MPRVVKIRFSLASLVLAGAFLMSAAGEAGRKAPELAFNVPGEGTKTLSQYQGKVVALEFIWTTCPHCQAASRLMSKLQTEYSARGLQVIDVAINPNADLLVEGFAKDYSTSFPVGWTTQDQMVSFMGFSDGRYVVPQLALIDRKGNIRYQTPAKENDDWDKSMKEDTIRKHIDELLGSNLSARNTSHGVASHSGSQ